MEKKINLREFTEEIIKLAVVLKERSAEKREKLKRPMIVIDLSSIEQEIYSFYMQKMADMTRKEIEELISDVNLQLKSKVLIKSLEKFEDADEFELEVRLLGRLAKENKENKAEINIPEDIEFDYIEGVLIKLVKTIHQIKPEYYPIYYGKLVPTDTTNAIKYYYSQEIEGNDIDFPDSLFLPIFKNKRFVKHIENIKIHYGYLFSKPFNYEILYTSIFLQIMLDYIELTFSNKFLEKILKHTKDEVNINFSKLDRLVKSLIELYIDFVLGKKRVILANEFSNFLTKTRKFLEQNYEELLDIVESEGEKYTEELIMFNAKVIENLKLNLSYLSEFEEKPYEDFKKLFKTVHIYGLENLEPEDLAIEFDSDNIYKLLLLILTISALKDLEAEAEITLEKGKLLISSIPYISKTYNYESIDNLMKLVVLEDEDKEATPENILPDFRYLWLHYLYKTERYEEFVDLFNKLSKIDKGLTEKLNPLPLYVKFAEYYLDKLTNEDLIEFIEKEGRKYILKNKIVKALIYTLSSEKKKLSTLLKRNFKDVKDIFYLINIYPYEPKFYEMLELKFDYEPKRKRF